MTIKLLIIFIAFQWCIAHRPELGRANILSFPALDLNNKALVNNKNLNTNLKENLLPSNQQRNLFLDKFQRESGSFFIWILTPVFVGGLISLFPMKQDQIIYKLCIWTSVMTALIIRDGLTIDKEIVLEKTREYGEIVDNVGGQVKETAVIIGTTCVIWKLISILGKEKN